MNPTIELSPLNRAEIDITIELNDDPLEPRATALTMALRCISLARDRVVVPKMRDGWVRIETGRDQHVEPREYRSPPLWIDIPQHSVDEGTGEDIIRAAQTASSRAPGWEPIFIEVMGGVCE